MQRDTFDEIVSNIIVPTGEALCAKYGARWNTRWETSAYNLYESTRSAIRQDMRLDPNFGDHRIDRHKIAAALSLAIVKSKPLEAEGANPQAGARMANEQLAIFSAIKVILHFVEHRLQATPTELAKLNGKSFSWPDSQDGLYVLHLSKALFHAIRNRFDAYLVANIYFLLEASHLRLCGVASLPQIPAPQEVLENA